MQLRITLLLSLTLLTANLFAQPGGGGGLVIGDYYTKQLKKINVNDPAFKLRIFALADTSANSKIIQEILPPRFHCLLPFFSQYETGNYVNFSNQRLFIVYNNDTMLIDFIGIMPENGMGLVDLIDSVVFERGHFRYFRNAPQVMENIYNMHHQVWSNGLTPYAINYLSKITFTVVAPDIDTTPVLKREYTENYFRKQRERNYEQPIINVSQKIPPSFLSGENLLATFYLRRGSYYLSLKKPEDAIPDIVKSVEMGVNRKEKKESLLLLYTAYSQKESYDTAIRYISELIRIRSAEIYARDNSEYNEPEHIKDNYRRRINLYIKNRQLLKALSDYDSLVSISKYYRDYEKNDVYILKFDEMHSASENVERAWFKMKHLQDYKGASSDLKDFINKIPDQPESETPQGVSGFKDIYFTLAFAEYHDGDSIAAFKHWLRAEELSYGYQSNSANVVIHFDTLTRKHPDIPELYLARAIASYTRGRSLHCSERPETCYESALRDIKKCEDLGLTDFRTNMYRALVLEALKKHEYALEQINIAISKKDNNARLYIERYWIRNNLGQAKNGDITADPDLKQYNELKKTWKFEK